MASRGDGLGLFDMFLSKDEVMTVLEACRIMARVYRCPLDDVVSVYFGKKGVA